MTGFLFGSLLLLLVLGVPVAVAIGLTSVLVLWQEDMSLVVVAQHMFSGTDSFSLVAIPFFILAGDLLAKGKVSERLVELAEAVLGFIRGGLWTVAVLASMFFAAISGSAAATTAAVGTPLIPELAKKHYRRDFSAALIASAGCIGVVIPPSVPMILYATVAEESVSRLFLNGFIPGILMGGTLVGIALVTAVKDRLPKGRSFSWANVWHTFKQAFWGLLTPLIILGGIFSGTFTPSEAAVIAVNYALLVALFVYRDMGLRDIFQVVANSAVTMSVIMFLIATSNIFSWVLANYRIPAQVAEAVLGLSDSALILLLLVNLLILLAGVFLETASAIIILTPIFLPLVQSLGLDPIHFGIILVLGLGIGMITPPVAINLYVASTITDLPLERISRAVLPMLAGLVIVLLVVTYLPLFVDIIV